MADTKITALAAITTVDPAADVLPIVDISDTSMAASGTTKKITSNQILGSGGTATLASATITGDLTAARLIVTGGTIPANGLWLPTTNTLEFAANSLAQYRIAPLGVFSWYDGAGGTRMTLNSTGLGIGVSPGSKLTVAAGTDADIGSFRGGSSRRVQIGTSSTAGYLNVDNTSAGLELRVNETARVYIDGSGNVGIGVAPSAPLDVRGPFNGTHAIFTGTVNRGLVIATRSDGLADSRTVIFNAAYSAGQLGQFAFQIAGTDRILMKNNGQLRFVPLASDPAGAEAGDVYYNSTSNKLKCYNGTTWNDLF
jgi:hypothetical protein